MLGRYMEADPIGMDGGWNPYAYAGNDPVNNVDPDGLILKYAIDLGKLVWNLSTKSASNVVKQEAKQQAKQEVKQQVKSSGAESSKQASNLKEHMRQTQSYGQGGVKELQNGKTRYYGEVKSANKEGEMAGRRTVREWNPMTNQKRTWHETIDHGGNVRQVRPELNNGTKTHYTFDKDGKYKGSW